ncbi:hypothetical protein Pcinc_009778 [Petrolisthes cinctipes]|uniref:Uncharacterized protein n=1 Tax=Petrolisthes cinctipes TaxID=88211 RepID=A0AAE1KY33_PETCI|nr:hypothetical protein Pcinc_009778 [Petrolisthes cinctipes]
MQLTVDKLGSLHEPFHGRVDKHSFLALHPSDSSALAAQMEVRSGVAEYGVPSQGIARMLETLENFKTFAIQPQRIGLWRIIAVD